MDNKIMFSCKLCNQVFKTSRQLSFHVRRIHKYKPKNYYDEFIKIKDENICHNPNCINEVKFISLGIGYSKHCSASCSTLNPSIKEKKKKTMIEKYGVKHALKSHDILNKMYENNTNKYGKRNVQQVSFIRERTKKTCIEKYGNTYPFCNEEIKIKIKKKMIINGSYNNNRKKSKKTCLEKYGVENISQLEDIKEKKKETCLKNNGYEYWVGSEEHKKYMKNEGAAHCNQFIKNPSKPQVKLFELCQEVLPYPILNYPCLNCSIDIAIPQLSLAIEYDGSYWHQNKEEDEKRQIKLEEEGWIFLRYVDFVPSREQLINDIKELI